MHMNLVIPVLFLVASALANGIVPPKKCGPGEVYKKCGTCDDGCKEPKAICPKKCREGCFCADGLVRDNDSNCIPREKCPGVCKEGEIYKDCGGCEKSCKEPNPVCTEECRKGCFCIDDYVRNATGQCIPAKDCPKCGPGEVYSECGTCEKTCEKREDLACTAECRVGCFCIKGYVRHKGQCIPAEDCPKCGPCEVYSECGTCEKSCGNLNPVCTRECRVGCFCIDGYVRDSEGRCIPAKDCPKCNPGEVYSECGGCDKSCGNRNPPCDKKCHVGCFCIDGYVRDIKGNCIPVKDCPKCKHGEVYSECGGCDKTCKNLNPICTLQCRVGCFCIDGYARDDNRRCIPIKKCPPQCKEGEVYLECGGAEKTCENLNPPGSGNCKAGCFCKDDYARDCTGKCVPIDKCPPKCKDGEVYTDCGTCDGSCDNPSPICSQQCRVGCYCKKGYLRNKDNLCIPAKECPPPQCKCNEVYKKCGTCEPTCDNPNPICPELVCRKGCFCKDKYVRNKAGDCIPLDRCCD